MAEVVVSHVRPLLFQDSERTRRRLQIPRSVRSTDEGPPVGRAASQEAGWTQPTSGVRSRRAGN